MDLDDARLRRVIEDAMERAAEEAARKVQVEMLTAMGFDVSTPEKLIQVQVDLAYLRRQRQASEQVGGLVKKTVIYVVLTGFLGAAWVGFQMAFRTGGGG